LEVNHSYESGAICIPFGDLVPFPSGSPVTDDRALSNYIASYAMVGSLMANCLDKVITRD